MSAEDLSEALFLMSFSVINRQNKRLSKGKKGKGKKAVDAFSKKDWYDIKAPSAFQVCLLPFLFLASHLLCSTHRAVKFSWGLSSFRLIQNHVQQLWVAEQIASCAAESDWDGPQVRNVGKTLVTRSSGMRVATEFLKGRVVEANLADLNKDEDQNYRKIKLQIMDVQGKNCLCNFYGMDMTTDKIRSLVKKWQVRFERALQCLWTD